MQGSLTEVKILSGLTSGVEGITEYILISMISGTASAKKLKQKLQMPPRHRQSIVSDLSHNSMLRKYSTNVSQYVSIPSNKSQLKDIIHLNKTSQRIQMNNTPQRVQMNNTPQRNQINLKALILPSPIRPMDKLVVFTDIEIYLGKLRGKDKIKTNKLNIFKLSIGKIDPVGIGSKILQVEEILVLCNEEVLNRQYKIRQKI
jgi:hypothetical protein